MMRVLPLLVATSVAALACDGSPSLFSRTPRPELACAVTAPAAPLATLGTGDVGWWFTDVATTTAGSWCTYDIWASAGSGALAALSPDGRRGSAVALDPSGLPTRTWDMSPRGSDLAVVFDVALDASHSERRFAVLDADGAPLEPAVPVPDGRLVTLDDGTFALVSVVPSGVPDHPDLVVRVLDDAGSVLAGPAVVARLSLPVGGDAYPFVGGTVHVAPAPEGFAVTWSDDAGALRVLVARPDGSLVLDPTKPGGTAVLSLTGATWVAWATAPPDTVHVAVHDDRGGHDEVTVVTTDGFAGEPVLFAVDETAVLAWSQGADRTEVCGGCFASHDLHLVPLTRDAAGRVVPAGDHLVVPTPDAALSLVGVAAFGDDLLLAMTLTGHATWAAATATVTCAPVDR